MTVPHPAGNTAPISSAVTDEEQVVAYVTRLFTTAREELHRADTKAAILLAGSTAVVAALLSASISGGWSPTRLGGAFVMVWWASTLAAGVAVALLAAAIYPRIRRTGTSPPATAYFADIAAYTDIAALRTALPRSAAQEFEETLTQLWRISRIVLVKYRLIVAGMWTLLIAAVGCCSAVALQVLTV